MNSFVYIFLSTMVQLTLLLTNLTWMLATSLGYKFYEVQELKPCPRLRPDTNVKFEELKGRWQLSLLILDAATEDIEESGICVTGELVVVNSTYMRQVWDMYTPKQPSEPVGTMELAVSEVTPGVWAMQTPLGAQLSATVFGYEMGCLMVAHCGWHRGKLVHLWTAGVTRENKLNMPLRIKLSTLLLDNGYEPSTTKLITWSKC